MCRETRGFRGYRRTSARSHSAPFRQHAETILRLIWLGRRDPMRLIPTPAISRILLAVFAITVGTTGATQTPVELQPNELVRRTVASEMKSTDQTAKYMFRERKETPEGSQTKLFVQTRDAMVGMLVAYNDHPLNQEQRRGEYGRIQHIIDNPSELEHKRAKEKEDAERVKSILKALPDAFLYEYDGTEPGKPGIGKPGDEMVRLKFRPNPKYEPPTRVEQVLTGMSGVVLIDTQSQHIARIDGTLFKDVAFGWGILGHLDRGGHFLVDQTDIGDKNWSISRMQLAFTGKLLLFKSLDIKSTEVYSDFQSVPADISFAEGAQLLRKQIATIAENQSQPESAK
jgi:hypothetical protein